VDPDLNPDPDQTLKYQKDAIIKDRKLGLC
jgi:hypothetical protein